MDGELARTEAAQPGAILVSVIVPTRNRCRLLREVIEALWAQTLAPAKFEVIVVDDGSTDGTDEVLAELQRRSPCRLVRHAMPSHPGPAHARNTGAGLARGEFLAFTDDDCRPTPRWLQAGLRGFREGVGLVTGRVLYKPEQVPGAGFFSRESGQVLEEHPTYSFSNSFYRRRVFLDMRGSDEALCRFDFLGRVIDCGDTDLAWRVKKSGHASVFVAEALVHHERQQMTPFRWLWEPVSLVVVPQLVRRHPELRRRLLHARLFFLKENAWFYLALLGGLLGALRHPAFLVLAVPYLAWMLSVLRHALSLRGLPKLGIQIVFLAARHAVLCGSLAYGSLRFRALVL